VRHDVQGVQGVQLVGVRGRQTDRQTDRRARRAALGCGVERRGRGGWWWGGGRARVTGVKQCPTEKYKNKKIKYISLSSSALSSHTTIALLLRYVAL
jgi:hypothetical protein